MPVKLGGSMLHEAYIAASLDASEDIYTDLLDFYNAYDGCAFE